MANPNPFYFAWVGGPPEPAFELTTTGDIWGGEITSSGITWGGSLSTVGDLLLGSIKVTNLLKDDGLVIGQSYRILATGIPIVDILDNPITVNMIYDGDFEGTLSVPADASAIGAQLIISSSSGRSTVVLSNIDGLISGRTYGIQAGGIPVGATFVFSGSALITISADCSTTSKNASIRITSPLDRDIIKNLESVSGLINGDTYFVFCQGVPANAIATFDGTNLILSENATVSDTDVTIHISKGVDWPDGGAFDPLVHLVQDEDIYSVDIEHIEGDFPTLSVEVKNPNVGLLSEGRNIWCWLSYDTGASVVAMFHGRLIGIQDHTAGEVVTLKFIARPNDFQSQKLALAADMKDPFYYDKVWLVERENDPDTVLETRTGLWHIDRLTLEVSYSDMITGEDGTIEITENFYDDLNVSYSKSPKRRINMTLIVNWAQECQIDLDLTDRLCQEFRSVGTKYNYPLISTFTGDGLLNSWPAPLTSIGEGWSVALQSTIVKASWAKTGRYAVSYIDKTAAGKTSQVKTRTTNIATVGTAVVPGVSSAFSADWVTYDVLFDLSVFSISFFVHGEASRQRSEIVSFSLEADVQSVMVEPGAAEQETIELHSDYISAPIDDDGSIPIGDLRRNSYFKTDRGQQSVRYGLMLARAKLISGARVVLIKFGTELKTAVDLTCRKNIHIIDRRLPGGEATGKVTMYALRASDSGEFKAEVTIQCTVGRGGSVSGSAGVPAYVDNGYVDSGYQEVRGGNVIAASGDLTYQNFDDFIITDDDGVDLFNLTDQTAVVSIEVLGGYTEQKKAIDKSKDPIASLTLSPTRVSVEMVSLIGGPFQSEYTVITSKVAIPQTINLEAA